MISKDEVKKIAELSLIAIEDSELDKLTGEIAPVLDYVSEIDKLAVDNGNEKEKAKNEKPELYNVMREDEVTNEKEEYTERMLREAPQTDGNYLRVKKIL